MTSVGSKRPLRLSLRARQSGYRVGFIEPPTEQTTLGLKQDRILHASGSGPREIAHNTIERRVI